MDLINFLKMNKLVLFVNFLGNPIGYSCSSFIWFEKKIINTSIYLFNCQRFGYRFSPFSKLQYYKNK